MDQLEKLITDFRDDIKNDIPHEGHFERFEMKLNAEKKTKSTKWIPYVASIAAILVVSLMVLKPSLSNSESITLSDLSEQYADVEYYYTSSIHKQTNLLNKLNNESGGDQSINMLIEEINTYDKVYEQLCVELNATPNDERVINAMITYYQTKLEIINKILNEIENKQGKTENYENNNI